MIIRNLQSPNIGLYDIIVTDPPWPLKKSNVRKVRPNQLKTLDYDTMSLADIASLHCSFLSKHTTKKHNVFCWTVEKFLPEAEQIFGAMGYKLHCRLVWDKKNGIAPAFTIRFCHEYLLWFYRPGNIVLPEKAVRGKYGSVLYEPSTTHSTKPVAARKMVEGLFPISRKIELFARKEHEGWDSYGDELLKPERSAGRHEQKRT